MSALVSTAPPAVQCLGDTDERQVRELLARYGLDLRMVADSAAIPGSYWGAPEAGLVGATLYARADTPIHSILHEAGHYVCMTPARRAELDTNAGGDYEEENGVCYLQIVLAEFIAGQSRERICADMDVWGYTFRLGSAANWFHHDADDARSFLERSGVVDVAGSVTWRLRGEAERV